MSYLVDEARPATADGHTDLCQAWLWRLSAFTDSYYTEDEPPDPTREPPTDMHEGWEPPQPDTAQERPARTRDADGSMPSPSDNEPEWDGPTDDAVLALEGMVRATLGPPEPTDADVARMMARTDAIAASPVPPPRIAEVNTLAAAYFERQLTSSWALPYLAERFPGHRGALSDMGAGYAPDSWTGLVSHLRRLGVTDIEMVTAGVALVASTGRLIDRFRDRLTLPILHDGRVLGFVARRNPGHADNDRRGPKYLNTPTTPLYSKSEHLFIAGPLNSDATPVIVEGPMDAWAVTLTGAGTFVGTAQLGTSLTEAQVAQLYRHGQAPIVATDADVAGQVAAEKGYWLLALYGFDPLHARLPEGADPADLLASNNLQKIRRILSTARPLAETLIDERLTHLNGSDAIIDAVRVLAAQPGQRWASGAEHIASQTGIPAAIVRAALAPMVRAWNLDPRKATAHAHAESRDIHVRLFAQERVAQPSNPPAPLGHSHRPAHPDPGVAR